MQMYKIPDGVQAIIFDMDGVLADTMHLHTKIEAQLLNEAGVHITQDHLLQVGRGVPFHDTVLRLVEDKLQAQHIIETKELEIERQAKGNIREIPGAVDLVKQCHGKYALAVASSSRKTFIKMVLDTLGIAQYFSSVCSLDDITKGKPDPEIFLLAAKQLAIDPKNCLVIEDGPAGMQGAKMAGMKCIGLAENNKEYPVDIEVQALSEIKV